MATALPANLLLAAELMDRPVLARLLQSALAVLDEIARTSKDPLQRRLAATTIVKVVTQRPLQSTRPRPENQQEISVSQPRTPSAPLDACTTHAREATSTQPSPRPTGPLAHAADVPPPVKSPPSLRPLCAPPAPAASLLHALARSSAP